MLIIAQGSVSPPWHETVTFALAVVGAGLGVYNTWKAWKAGRAQKRQDSPFFMHDELLVLHRGDPRPDGSRFECFNYPPAYADVPEDYGEGEPVHLRAYNHGGEARLVEVDDLEGNVVEGDVYHVFKDGKPQLTLTYPYSKQRRGTVERFRVSYETVSGERGEQIFDHRHGLKGLKRVSIK